MSSQPNGLCVGVASVYADQDSGPGLFLKAGHQDPRENRGILAMTANGLNLMLIWHLAHVGLALATAISHGWNAGLLGRRVEAGWGVYPRGGMGWAPCTDDPESRPHGGFLFWWMLNRPSG